MPFGLTNTPIVFQQFMNNIFSNLLDVCVVIYLNDILIYLSNMSKYHQHVKKYSSISPRLVFMPKQRNVNFTLS